MRGVGKTLAAKLRGDNQTEEALFAHVFPYRFRQVVILVGQCPVVEHAAEGLNRAVNEGLLLFAQLRRPGRDKALPARSAGKQLAVPVHRPGFQRLGLGVRQGRQHSADPRQQGAAHPLETLRPGRQQHRGGKYQPAAHQQAQQPEPVPHPAQQRSRTQIPEGLLAALAAIKQHHRHCQKQNHRHYSSTPVQATLVTLVQLQRITSGN